MSMTILTKLLCDQATVMDISWNGLVGNGCDFRMPDLFYSEIKLCVI